MAKSLWLVPAFLLGLATGIDNADFKPEYRPAETNYPIEQASESGYKNVKPTTPIETANEIRNYDASLVKADRTVKNYPVWRMLKDAQKAIDNGDIEAGTELYKRRNKILDSISSDIDKKDWPAAIQKLEDAGDYLKALKIARRHAADVPELYSPASVAKEAIEKWPVEAPEDMIPAYIFVSNSDIEGRDTAKTVLWESIIGMANEADATALYGMASSLKTYGLGKEAEQLEQISLERFGRTIATCILEYEDKEISFCRLFVE